MLAFGVDTVFTKILRWLNVRQNSISVDWAHIKDIYALTEHTIARFGQKNSQSPIQQFWKPFKELYFEKPSREPSNKLSSKTSSACAQTTCEYRKFDFLGEIEKHYSKCCYNFTLGPMAVWFDQQKFQNITCLCSFNIGILKQLVKLPTGSLHWLRHCVCEVSNNCYYLYNKIPNGLSKEKVCTDNTGFVMLHVLGLFCHVITVVQMISFSMWNDSICHDFRR